MVTVQAAGIKDLARSTTTELREALAEMSVGLTRPAAASAPKIFRLNHTLGPGTVVKLLVVILRAFVDSVRVPDKMDAADIIDTAEVLAATYTHDSLKDIILALREARLSGKVFYQCLDPAQVFGIVKTYFENKATWLSHHHQDLKTAASSAHAATVAQLSTAAPQVLANVALMLPPNHPAQESLRRKLSLTKARERRGLMSPEQAEASRATVRQVLANGCRDYSQPTNPANP